MTSGEAWKWTVKNSGVLSTGTGTGSSACFPLVTCAIAMVAISILRRSIEVNGRQELERRTEMGLAMHNMLAKGQVVPFAMTLELLKGVANLTCSEKLVIQNCPQQLGADAE